MDDPGPSGARDDLARLANEAVEELRASGQFAIYSGRLPPATREKLRSIARRFDDEALLEDLVAERMIALTQNQYVEEAGDADLSARVLTPSHHRPVLVDVYSDYCRPCNHVLPVVYQLAEKYRDDLTVVKINISKHAGFRNTYLGPLQLTPSFLFFRNGRPVQVGGRLARLLGQTAFVATTRARLETRIRAALRQ